MRPSLPSKSVRGGESGSSKQLAFHFVAPIELVHDECPLCAQPGSKPEAVLLERHVRSALKSRHRQTTPACPFGANSGSETFHSITSSARARSDGGTVRPSRFGRPMRSCVVNSRTRSTLALFEHFQRPVGVHGHYQLAADHLEHGQVGIDHERYALQRHHRNPPPDPELACDHLIAVR